MSSNCSAVESSFCFHGYITFDALIGGERLFGVAVCVVGRIRTPHLQSQQVRQLPAQVVLVNRRVNRPFLISTAGAKRNQCLYRSLPMITTEDLWKPILKHLGRRQFHDANEGVHPARVASILTERIQLQLPNPPYKWICRNVVSATA